MDPAKNDAAQPGDQPVENAETPTNTETNDTNPETSATEPLSDEAMSEAVGKAVGDFYARGGGDEEGQEPEEVQLEDGEDPSDEDGRNEGQEAEGAQPDEEALTETPPDLEAAMRHVIANSKIGIAKLTDMAKNDPEQLLDLAGALGYESEAPEPETTGAEAEAETDGDAPAFDEKKVAKAVSDALGDEFTDSEVERMSVAIMAGVRGAVESMSGGGDAQLQQTVKQQSEALTRISNAYADLVAKDHVRTNLAPVYDEAGTREGEAAILKKAGELYQGGMRDMAIPELVDLAAATLYGAKQKQQIHQHKKRVNKARNEGQSTSVTGVDAGGAEADPFVSAIRSYDGGQTKT